MMVYLYCKVGVGGVNDFFYYEGCLFCVVFYGLIDYLINYFKVMEVGCV